jgi:hypothetical protein
MVRAKFRVNNIADTNGNPADGKTITLSAVTSANGNAENAEFFKYTPAGDIVMQTVNPAAAEQFEIGKEYYVDFTPAN